MMGISSVNICLPENVYALEAAGAAGAYTIGQLVWSLFSAAGASMIETGTQLANDISFGSEARLDNLFSDWESYTDENGNKYDSLEDYFLNGTTEQKQEQEDKFKTTIDDWQGLSTGNDFVKNEIVPVTVTYEKLSNGDGGTDPTPTPSEKKSGISWLWERVKMLALAGAVSLNMLSGSPSMSEVLQEYAQPQIEYMSSYDIAQNTADLQSNLPSNYKYYTVPVAVFDNNGTYVYYMSSSVKPYFYEYNVHLGYNYVFTYPTYNNSSSINCIGFTNSAGIWKVGSPSSIKLIYGENGNGETAYWGSLSFSNSNVRMVGGGGYNTTTNNYYAPNITNNNGNVYNINNIQPVIDSSHVYKIPSTDTINNYVNNYNTITNNNQTYNTDEYQNDIINNYNEYITPLITEQTVKPDPVVTTSPVISPEVSPEVTVTPAPVEDDSENLFPNLWEYFPFCIPWDIYAVMEKFVAEPEAPVLELPLKSNLYGIDETITIDLSEYDDKAKLCRNLELILFMVGLFFATKKLINK